MHTTVELSLVVHLSKYPEAQDEVAAHQQWEAYVILSSTLLSWFPLQLGGTHDVTPGLLIDSPHCFPSSPTA
jgi:hypothetical protein